MAASLDYDQVSSMARLSFLAMCARSIASEVFEGSPDVASLHLSISRSDDVGEPLPADLEYLSTAGHFVGGRSL